MIREAYPSDRNAIVSLLRDAHAAATVMPFEFSEPHAIANCDRHTSDPDYLALVLDDDGVSGVLLASSQPHPFVDAKYAFETVWWISKDARGSDATAMLDRYEAWARSSGCLFAGMAALATFPRAKIIYKRRGYSETETHFLKRL